MTDDGQRRDIDDVRGELRRLGYLSDRFDRFLLQDALRPRPSGRAMLFAAGRVAVLAGLVVAAVLALVLAAVNGNLTTTPFDLLPLFLHLLPPVALASGAAFLALAALLLAVLRFYPVRRIETLSLVTSALAAAALGALLAARLLELAHGGVGVGWLVGAAVLAALVVAAVAKVVHGALLALVMRWTRAVPERRALSRRFVAAGLLVVAGVLVLPPLLSARQQPHPAPVSMPAAPGESVLLVGVDGVLGEELDYLLASGRLPQAQALLDSGGRLFRYPRSEAAPASFWTSVATGHGAADHGVTSVDSFRPLGVATPLSRSGPLRPYWSRVAVPLGLAEYRPLLSTRRDVFTFWELAARGGDPVVAVNWWSTFPAEALPGLVVAHGAYQLLHPEDGGDGAGAGDVPGAVSNGVPGGVIAPPEARTEMAALARRAAAALEGDGGGGQPLEGDGETDGEGGDEGEGGAPPVPAALPAEARPFLLPAVLAPDRFYRRALLAGLDADTRAAALYLPGPDIAAAGWRWTDLAFGDLLARELAAADHTLGRALDLQRPGTVILVVDPGRRRPARAEGDEAGDGGGAEGRILVWTAAGCAADGAEGRAPAADGLPALDPREVASALLRSLGLPQSAELPPPPAACPWPPAPTTLPSFGSRHPAQAPGEGPGASDPDEYLESLRALGYL